VCKGARAKGGEREGEGERESLCLFFCVREREKKEKKEVGNRTDGPRWVGLWHAKEKKV
jgi:hypothetical protein